MRRIIKRIINKTLSVKGFSSYMALYHAELLYNDWFKEKRYSWKQKVWAQRRGFFVNQINVYGLDETNYKKYLSDYDYHKMFPLNSSKYSWWVNDKLSFKYVLSRYDQYLPEYYFSISETGSVNKLMNAPTDIFEDLEGIAELIKKKKVIVAKRIAGSCGVGFYKLEHDSNIFYVNGKKYNDNEFIGFLRSLKGYLITEFVVQNEKYARIFNDVVHTLRVQTIKQDDEPAECLFTFIRWGNQLESKNSAVKEMEDCVTAIPDRELGMITEGFYVDEDNKYIACKEHPITKESITGIVPNWNLILKKCLEIHDYLGQLEYLGFDVIVTDEAFKICEINTASSIRAIQRVMPLLADEKAKKFYMKHMR